MFAGCGPTCIYELAEILINLNEMDSQGTVYFETQLKDLEKQKQTIIGAAK